MGRAAFLCGSKRPVHRLPAASPSSRILQLYQQFLGFDRIYELGVMLGRLLLLAGVANAFYIPGWSVKSYKEREQIPLYVNKVTSDQTQLPYEYGELPFVCRPKQERHVGLNLGEVLGGDRISESEYAIQMGIPTQCETLCEVTVDQAGLEMAHELVSNDYVVEWIVDNLPGATAFIAKENEGRYYAAGFPLGSIDEKGNVLLNNHVTILLRYRPAPRDTDRYVIVGFEVYPKSVSIDSRRCPGSSQKFDPHVISKDKMSDTIRFTYSVYWVEDTSIEWQNRWDMYFSYADKSSHLHWMSVVHSLVIVSMLSFLVAVVLYRTLRRDIAHYNRQLEQGTAGESDKDLEDDISGWKLVSADVFRAPKLSTLLTALVGSGTQFLLMAGTVVGFASVGVLNPSYRGGLLSYAVFLFAFSGVVGGYVNSRLNRRLENGRWAAGLVSTAVVAPASIMLVVLGLNLFVWAQASSSALPFSTILALFAIWLLISCPLVFLGGYIGAKRPMSQRPGRVSAIPRQIPPLRAYQKLVVSTLVSGLPPFFVVFVEMVFVFKSIWEEKSGYYYVYGFLALSLVLLIVTVMEMSIVTTYLQLNAEDYRWWWRSFMVGTGSAWWVFLYSIYYFFAVLKVEGFVSGLLFFGYSLIGCSVYGLVTGAIGFLASYVLVHRMYGAIKAD